MSSTLNFDFMDDAFFKQTPAQLKQVGEMLRVHPNLFKLTFKQLTEYALKANIPLPSNSNHILTKKRMLIRKILMWEQIQSRIQSRIQSVSRTSTASQTVCTMMEDEDSEVDSEDEDEVANAIKNAVKDAEQLICGICRIERRNIVFNDCRHVICCEECGRKCGLKCPMCRTNNKTKQKIFFC